MSNDFPKVELGPFIELLAISSEFVMPKKQQNPVCEDPDDNKFLARALACTSKIIISGISIFREFQSIRESKLLNLMAKIFDRKNQILSGIEN